LAKTYHQMRRPKLRGWRKLEQRFSEAAVGSLASSRIATDAVAHLLSVDAANTTEKGERQVRRPKFAIARACPRAARHRAAPPRRRPRRAGGARPQELRAGGRPAGLFIAGAPAPKRHCRRAYPRARCAPCAHPPPSPLPSPLPSPRPRRARAARRSRRPMASGRGCCARPRRLPRLLKRRSTWRSSRRAPPSCPPSCPHRPAHVNRRSVRRGG